MKTYNLCLEKSIPDNLRKFKKIVFYNTFLYISVSADYAIVISVSVSTDMKIWYIGGYRYRPISKNAYRSSTTRKITTYLISVGSNPNITNFERQDINLHCFDDKIRCLSKLDKYDCEQYQLAIPWDDLPIPLIRCDQRIQIPNTIFFVFEILQSDWLNFHVSVSAKKILIKN